MEVDITQFDDDDNGHPGYLVEVLPAHDTYAEPKVGLEAQYLPALSSVV